jgi:diguanylate cyclase (GGDEF)-like protein
MELLNLEEINSQYGEAVANHAILELSHLLKDQLRWADIISRTDDTHIMIILPETSRDDSGRLAEKINANVAELQIRYEGAPNLQLQACYGVASWAKGNDSLLLLRNANQAMIKARSQGTGVVEVA